MDKGLRNSTRNLASLALLLFLAAIGVTGIYSRLPTDVANFIASLRSGQLSRLDRATMERGYYEDLTRVNRFNDQLWDVYNSKPKDWLDVQGTGLTRFTGDFLQIDLIPSFVARTSWSDISTNRWGMRDQDYGREPAPGATRIAVLGASLEMGWGVEDGETYEAVLEDMLNAHATEPASPIKDNAFEILNFAVAGYRPLQQVAMIDRALEFSPDVVIFVAHGLEITRATRYLAEVVRKEIEIPYPDLRAIVELAGIGPATSETEAIRLLTPHRNDILFFAYSYLVKQSRDRGTIPVLMMFEQDWSSEAGQREIPTTLELAEKAGFEVLVLDNAYEGYSPEDVRLATWDEHPNSLGHRLIAEALFAALIEDPGIIGLTPGAGTTSSP